MMKRKTLPERIDEVLNGKPMKYYDLARALYPDGKSWNYQANGGPPGCFMALSAALGRGGFRSSLGITTQSMVHPRTGVVKREEKNVTVA